MELGKGINYIASEMELDIESKLNNTHNLFQELGNSVSSLVNSSPDVFDDPSIKVCLKEFLTVYQEAVQRLENPSFRIATIGTTSSGKSTIVNAIIGRKIAPIEAGEMSGGVLTLQHFQEHVAECLDALSELSARLEGLEYFLALCESRKVKSIRDILPDAGAEVGLYVLPPA